LATGTFGHKVGLAMLDSSDCSSFFLQKWRISSCLGAATCALVNPNGLVRTSAKIVVSRGGYPLHCART
jgi:hypothetical protein